MNYKISLVCEVEAKTEAEAKKQAIKMLTVSEALPLAVSPQAIVNRLEFERVQEKEYFIAFMLNTQNEIIYKNIVSIGTLNSSLIHPREVFRQAIIDNSASIIVAHNHPSGSLEPSQEDLAVTKRLQDAGKLLGIEVLDHIIVTKNGYSSLRERNLL